MSRTRTETRQARTLTTKDLDERIVRVAAELFGPHLAEADAGDWTPVPISTADYVRRMRPFLVYN